MTGIWRAGYQERPSNNERDLVQTLVEKELKVPGHRVDGKPDYSALSMYIREALKINKL